MNELWSKSISLHKLSLPKAPGIIFNSIELPSKKSCPFVRINVTDKHGVQIRLLMDLTKISFVGEADTDSYQEVAPEVASRIEDLLSSSRVSDKQIEKRIHKLESVVASKKLSVTFLTAAISSNIDNPVAIVEYSMKKNSKDIRQSRLDMSKAAFLDFDDFDFNHEFIANIICDYLLSLSVKSGH